MDNTPILKVKNLKVELGKEEVIKDLSFEVKQGEIFTVLGPNGAGKTTLFKALLGLIPYEGEIKWAQKDINIGYLPERLSRSEFKGLPISVKEFFRFKQSSEEKILEMLRLAGLRDPKILGQNPGTLSSGQFQRFLIAWAMINSPRVLFFDEPTAGIDIGGEETIYSLLRKFWKRGNLTIFLITHDLNIVYRYSTDILCLNRKAVCSGRPREILTPETLERVYGAKIKFYQHSHQ